LTFEYHQIWYWDAVEAVAAPQAEPTDADLQRTAHGLAHKAWRLKQEVNRLLAPDNPRRSRRHRRRRVPA
jgi:hypothetical protein